MQHAALLTAGEAATRLRVSVARVRQLDGELEPARTATGRRIYSADAVERLAAMRDARAKERDR